MLRFVWLVVCFSLAHGQFPCKSTSMLPTKITLELNLTPLIDCEIPTGTGVDNQTFPRNPITYFRTVISKDGNSDGDFNIDVVECGYVKGNICPDGTFYSYESELPNNQNLCCKNIHANYTHENSVELKDGQELSGGAVRVGTQLIGYDYISNMKRLSQDTYQIQTRRLVVSGEEEPQNPNQVESANKPVQQFAAPTYPAQPAAPTFPLQPVQQFAAPTYPVQAGAPTYPAQTGAGAGPTSRSRAHQRPIYVVPPGENPSIIIPRGGGGSNYYPVQPSYGGAYPQQQAAGGGGVLVLCRIFHWVYFDQVTTFLHRMPKQKAEFFEISTKNGKNLKLTNNHLIYKVDCQYDYSENEIGALKPVQSQELTENDCLLTWNKIINKLEKSEILSIKIVAEEGIYAPMTTSGNILVNGVHASCDSVSTNNQLLLSASKIVSWFNGLRRTLIGNANDDIEIPFSASVLQTLATHIVPDYKIF